MNAWLKDVWILVGVCIFCMHLGMGTVLAETKNDESSLTKLETSNPHTVYQYSESVFSGSAPDDEDAFLQLKKLGIKTILSVNGAKPKVELAKQHGMRYVHIPVQYRTITEDQSLMIAKAVRDLTSPVYIHSHHGKHRAPTAASLSMVLLDKWSNPSAVKAMLSSGTGKNYIGLYQAAGKAQPVAKEVLDNLDVEFVETAAVSPVVETMVQIQTIYDNLKLAQNNNWRPIGEKDIDPKHEALQLRELFYDFNRTGAAKDEDNTYRSLVTNGEGAAISLENALRDWKPAIDEEPPKTFRNLMNRITRNCTACHTVFRNSPR